MQRCRAATSGSARKLPLGVCTSTRSPGRTSRSSHREKTPPGTSRTPMRGGAALRRADGVRAALLLAVDGAAQGQRLARREVVVAAQVLGHLEGDRRGVVGERLDRRDGQGVEGAATAPRLASARADSTAAADTQISLTWSKGSRHGRAAVHRLAGRGSELRRQRDVARPAARAAHVATRRRQRQGDRPRRCRRAGPGGEIPCSARACDRARRSSRSSRPASATPRRRPPSNPSSTQPAHEVVAHGGHRRAAGVGRRDRHGHRRRPRPARRAGRRGPRASASAAPGRSRTAAHVVRAVPQDGGRSCSPPTRRVGAGDHLHLGEQRGSAPRCGRSRRADRLWVAATSATASTWSRTTSAASAAS